MEKELEQISHCLLCGALQGSGGLQILAFWFCDPCVNQLLRSRADSPHYDTYVRNLRPLGKAIIAQWAS